METYFKAEERTAKARETVKEDRVDQEILECHTKKRRRENEEDDEEKQ